MLSGNGVACGSPGTPAARLETPALLPTAALLLAALLLTALLPAALLLTGALLDATNVLAALLSALPIPVADGVPGTLAHPVRAAAATSTPARTLPLPTLPPPR
jgi:hypothetical protein